MDHNKVLIIDDDISFIRPAEVALTEAGFEVGAAPNGALGRQVALKMHPDLIILDIMMPGEHGISTLEKIKGDPELKGIPVIISTNLEKALPIVKEKSDGFILKSEVSLPGLVEKVRALIIREK